MSRFKLIEVESGDPAAVVVAVDGIDPAAGAPVCRCLGAGDAYATLLKLLPLLEQDELNDLRNIKIRRELLSRVVFVEMPEPEDAR